MIHSASHLDFDLDNTLFFFTAGRYEYRNKGLDMFVESMSRKCHCISELVMTPDCTNLLGLNERLKHHNSPMTVIAFIVSPAPTNSFTAESLKGQAVVKLLHDTVNSIQQKVGSRIFDKAVW
jgi:glycogen(starch) synthase